MSHGPAAATHASAPPLHAGASWRTSRTKVAKLKRALDSIEGEVRCGAIGANGMPVPYLAERMTFLRGEAARLQAELGRLNSLGGEELVKEMIPELAKAAKAAEEPARFLPTCSTRGDRCSPSRSSFRRPPTRS